MLRVAYHVVLWCVIAWLGWAAADARRGVDAGFDLAEDAYWLAESARHELTGRVADLEATEMELRGRVLALEVGR